MGEEGEVRGICSFERIFKNSARQTAVTDFFGSSLEMVGEGEICR